MAFSFRANDNRGWTERCRIDDNRAMKRDARSYRKDYARPARDRKGLDDKRKRDRVRHNRSKSHSGKKQKADSDFGQGDVSITRIFRFLEETSETEEAEFDFALSSLESFSHTARQTAA